MTPTRQGSFHLFRFTGVDVFLHWTWFVVATYQVSSRDRGYSSLTWNVLEYLALFLIVLLHEFGHALACRQAGGQANLIVLWPLGGVAYVNPPPRPGATLWSIAAGPLVNAALVPLLGGFWLLSRSLGWAEALPDLHAFFRAINVINLVLLIFNLLPIYPLDGGQILRALLWFGLGRARSLTVASLIGLTGVAILFGAVLWMKSVWLGIMSGFILLNCGRSLLQARVLARVAQLPRHTGFVCPACKAAPPTGALWKCGECQRAFDTFAARAVCPHCGTQFSETACTDCGIKSPLSGWVVPPPLPANS